LWLLWTKGPWPLTNGWFALFSGLAALSGNRLALEKIRGNHGLGYCATCHCCSLFRRGQNCLSSRNLISASANLPEAFVLIVEMQSAISRIVALAAVGQGMKLRMCIPFRSKSSETAKVAPQLQGIRNMRRFSLAASLLGLVRFTSEHPHLF